MGKLQPADRIFSENVDRLVDGREVSAVPESDRDLQSALDFARLIKYRQPQPSPRFREELKTRLLVKLAQAELEPRLNWFQRWQQQMTQPRMVWTTVTAVAAIIVIAGVVWGILWNNRGVQPVTQAVVSPVTTTTAAAAPATIYTTGTTAAAASTTAAAATTSPAAAWAGIQGVRLSAEAGTDKSVYSAGERVVINVSLKNYGSQPLTLTQFPIIVSLMSETGQPVFTFKAGQSERVLSPGETVTFSNIWDQKDARQRDAGAGRYYLELEDIDFYGQAYRLELERPVSFDIIY